MKNRRFRYAVFCAALLVVALPWGFALETTGVIVSDWADPILSNIRLCINHEVIAVEALGDDDRAKLDPDGAAAEQVMVHIDLAKACLDVTRTLLMAPPIGESPGDTGFRISALGRIGEPAAGDISATGVYEDFDRAEDKLGRGKKVKGVLKLMDLGRFGLEIALLRLQRNPGNDTAPLRTLYGRFPTFEQVTLYGVDFQDRAARDPIGYMAARRIEFKKDPNVQLRRRREKTPKAVGKKKAPKNFYLGWSPGDKNREPHFGVIQLPLQVRGPFTAGMTAGVFDLKKADPDEATFGCMEFDLNSTKGDDLVFFNVCVRRVNGGTQVFAASTGGVDEGSTFFAGSAVVEIRIVYEGDEFKAYAKTRGAPDASFKLFASHTRAQGAEHWVPLFGVNSISGKVEFGMDDIYFLPRALHP